MMLIEALEIAPHLTYGEIMDKESGLCLAHIRLLEAWCRFRAEVGKPIRINSGFRTVEYNAKVGGAKDSRHILGQAIDMQCNGEDLSDLKWIPVLLKCGFRGVGRGNGWIHADVRALPTFWKYTAGGMEKDVDAYVAAE
jgi:hypothetical protein